ncbi:MAG: hypothetical protein ACJA2H_001065 [Nitriliruptoraceae bacterium]|jgi:hypothetical protein
MLNSFRGRRSTAELACHRAPLLDGTENGARGARIGSSRLSVGVGSLLAAVTGGIIVRTDAFD